MNSDHSRANRAERIQEEIEALRERAANATFPDVRLAYLELALILARTADGIENGHSRPAKGTSEG